MASSWIKVEVITPDKPEIHRMAEALNIDPDAVLGKLVRIWAWADQQTIDGNAGSVTKSVLDRIAFVTGFADSLINVGWLAYEGDLLVFPNFERHNGESSKKRALTNRRVAEHRKTVTQKVTQPALQKALPEEEEEEDLKDKTTLLTRGKNFKPQELPPIGKFVMHDGWSPSPDFQRQAAQWGRNISGPDPGYSAQELSRFVSYWASDGKAQNQTQWEIKFADSVIHDRRKAAKDESGGSNAGQQQEHWTSGKSRAVQKFLRATEARHGEQYARSVAGDDRVVHGSVGGEERGGTVITVDSGDRAADGNADR